MTFRSALTLGLAMVSAGLLWLLPRERSEGFRAGRAQGIAESMDGTCAVSAHRAVLEQLESIESSIVREP